MEKYYTKYKNESLILNYKTLINNDPNKKGTLIRGVYDIETNNDLGIFIVGGLALWNGRNEEDIINNYNITLHNKPQLVLQEIYKHNKELGGFNVYEIAIHNLAFDIQSLIYNMFEIGNIKYSSPGKYGRQPRNTYSLVMNERKQIFSFTVNYCGISIIFWDSLKLYPAKLEKLCEVYKLKYYKKEANETTYNSLNFSDFCSNTKNIEYLMCDLLSLAELIDRNYYKFKTASANAWDNMKYEICLNLGLKKKTDSKIKGLIEFWGNNKINDYCLPGYTGGYCYANPTHVNKIFKNVLHLDINSSYPNAMDKIDFPLTSKISNKIESKRFLIFVYGEFILKENSYPVIKHPHIMNDYVSYYKGKILLTDIEWERINKNYNINKLKIIEVMNFPKTEKILSSFIQKNYAMKQNSTGFLREKAKLNLNSAYGKLAEHHDGQLYEAYINDKNMVCFKISDETINLITTEKSRCVIWAMYITAFAREKLYKCIDALGLEHFLYTDTDSIFTDLSENEVKEKFKLINEELDDKKLGAWAVEGHSPYFKCLRAKCYLKTDENKEGKHVLNYVVAGYNGSELVYGYNNKPIDSIPSEILTKIFDEFKIGRKVYDKETSVTTKFGIKMVKIKSEFEIKEKMNIFEFIENVKVGDYIE